jgi:hypothetical protein
MNEVRRSPHARAALVLRLLASASFVTFSALLALSIADSQGTCSWPPDPVCALDEPLWMQAAGLVALLLGFVLLAVAGRISRDEG